MSIKTSRVQLRHQFRSLDGEREDGGVVDVLFLTSVPTVYDVSQGLHSNGVSTLKCKIQVDQIDVRLPATIIIAINRSEINPFTISITISVACLESGCQSPPRASDRPQHCLNSFYRSQIRT